MIPVALPQHRAGDLSPFLTTVTKIVLLGWMVAEMTP